MRTLMERILVLQLKRIGDLILTFPTLAALRAARPGADITLVVAGAAGGMSEVVPGADRVLVYRKGSANFGLWRVLLAGRFALCLDFTGTDRSALMAKVSGAARRATYAKLAAKKRRRGRLYDVQSEASVRELHTVDYHHALLEAAGIEAVREPLSLEIPDDAVARVAALCPAEPFVLLHAGTAREEKYWLASRWAEVIDGLDLPVVLTGAEDPYERAHLDAIKSASARPVIDLSGGLSLVELAAVIARCELALGVDTAAMHLAACFEKPQAVLYGPTNPYHWRPRHDRAAIALAGEDAPVNCFTPKHVAAPMDELSTAAVIRAMDTARGTC